VCQLFGCGDSKSLKSPTRLIFRDNFPDKETKKTWATGVDSEVKTEVLIDRKTGIAYHRIGPRKTERIPAFSTFDFSFSLRFFEGDDRKDLLNFLAEGFELIEKDYLGGSGSRGYGHVAFVADDGSPMHEFLRKTSL
jgi:CRISPR-associated protein Csm3